jgi:hypothetical protein
MYILEEEAGEITCHKTISPTSNGKPCKGRKCAAFRPVDWMMTPCPHCGEVITATDSKQVIWHCVAQYKYG